MSPEDASETDIIAAGRQAELVPEFEEAAALFRRMTAHRLSSGPFTTERDRLANHGDGNLGASIARSIRRAVTPGISGWLDDSVALASDWGFLVRDIAVPVVVRHGERDRRVDSRQGRWLAATIPGAVADIRPEEGHGSIAYPFGEVITQLLRAAER
jgi:pimeloyl-ACP methyl ester carboxylesterase